MHIKILKTRLFLILLILPLFNLSQNINVDPICLLKNSARMSEAMIQFKGEKLISKMLKKEMRLLFFIEVDSSGQVLRIKKIIPNRVISKCTQDRLESFLKENNINFYLCYESLPGKSYQESESILKKIFEQEGRNIDIINIGFPGLLMIDYMEDSLSPNRVSKIEYLINIINKYK